MRWAPAAAAALVAAGAAGAAPPPYRNPTPGSVLVYQIPGMHRAKVVRNLVYRHVSGQLLRLDVYHPRGWNGRTPLPAVIIGGPPAYSAGKDSGQKIGWSQLVAASGLAAVTFDTRSDNFLATPEDPSEDVQAAIAYARDHAARLGIDPGRLCTLGFSLGTAPWHLWAAMHDPQPWNRCNVTYYGPPDLTHGFQMDPAAATEYSALTYLRRDGVQIAPLLIGKAARDSFPAIPASIDRFVAEARSLGAPVRLLTHPRGVHGFDLENPDATSRRIIRQTLAFLREHLLGTG
jgi:acetyl esterase